MFQMLSLPMSYFIYVAQMHIMILLFSDEAVVIT